MQGLHRREIFLLVAHVYAGEVVKFLENKKEKNYVQIYLVNGLNPSVLSDQRVLVTSIWLCLISWAAV